MKKEENLRKILEHFKLYSAMVPLDKCGSEREKKSVWSTFVIFTQMVVHVISIT